MKLVQNMLLVWSGSNEKDCLYYTVCIILCFILLCGVASAETFLDVARDYINDLYDEEVLATDVSAEEAFSEWEYDEKTTSSAFLSFYNKAFHRKTKREYIINTITYFDEDEEYFDTDKGFFVYDKNSDKAYYVCVDIPVDRLIYIDKICSLSNTLQYSGERFETYYVFTKEGHRASLEWSYFNCNGKPVFDYNVYGGGCKGTAASFHDVSLWAITMKNWTDGFMYGYYDD